MNVSCHRPVLPGTSLEPAVIPTAQASSFTLQYFPYYVWFSKNSLLLLLLLLLLLFLAACSDFKLVLESSIPHICCTGPMTGSCKFYRAK